MKFQEFSLFVYIYVRKWDKVYITLILLYICLYVWHCAYKETLNVNARLEIRTFEILIPLHRIIIETLPFE